jgi:plastocyanin
MRHTILVALLGAALLTACGDDGAPAESADTTAAIRIKDFKFVPNPATVQAGVAISLPNEDRAPHTLTDMAQPRAFDSGTIAMKQTGSITFKNPGTYKVFCELHPYMKGTLRVIE